MPAILYSFKSSLAFCIRMIYCICFINDIFIAILQRRRTTRDMYWSVIVELEMKLELNAPGVSIEFRYLLVPTYACISIYIYLYICVYEYYLVGFGILYATEGICMNTRRIHMPTHTSIKIYLHPYMYVCICIGM